MITKFKGNSFGLKNILNFINVLLVYILMFRHPFIQSYSLDLIPQINVREVLHVVIGGPVTFISFGASITIFVLDIFDSCVCLSSISDDFYLKDTRTKNYKKPFTYNMNILDLSNPFLHAGKTAELRE